VARILFGSAYCSDAHPLATPARTTRRERIVSDEAARMIERLTGMDTYGYQSQLACEAADLIASQQAEIARLRDEAERQAWNVADHYNGPDKPEVK
jgi:hypothetical protein